MAGKKWQLRKFCREHGCDLCRREREGADFIPVPPGRKTEDNEIRIRIRIRTEQGERFRFENIPASRVCVTHGYEGDIRGLMRLIDELGVVSLEDLRHKTRREIDDVTGVGGLTMDNLDQLLAKYGRGFSSSIQLGLAFEGEK